jgi:demethylmenaquinone methyltransferase/2-methoxy-6-polyprenyl-1,4-benzoquinol methylase
MSAAPPGPPAPAYDEQLRLALELTAPAARAAIADFAQAGTRGLDVGCGQGQHALWLAEAAGPRARVTGLDASEAHLEAAHRLAAATPEGGRVDFVQSDLRTLPFDDEVFDWVWCADTLWPGLTTDDPVRSLAELRRVLRPGGSLGLFYWSSQTLLPGYPLLEANLGAAFSARVPYLAAVEPDRHFLRATGWLSAAGCRHAAARTYLAELRGPLSTARREALSACLEMLWGGLEEAVAPRDWALFARLRDPAALGRDDYYGFIAYTLFSGLRDD